MRKIVVSVSERCGGFLSGESLRLDGGKQGLQNWECGQRAGFIWRAKDDISFKLRDAAWRQRTEPAVQRALLEPGLRRPRLMRIVLLELDHAKQCNRTVKDYMPPRSVRYG